MWLMFGVERLLCIMLIIFSFSSYQLIFILLYICATAFQFVAIKFS